MDNLFPPWAPLSQTPQTPVSPFTTYLVIPSALKAIAVSLSPDDVDEPLVMVDTAEEMTKYDLILSNAQNDFCSVMKSVVDSIGKKPREYIYIHDNKWEITTEREKATPFRDVQKIVHEKMNIPSDAKSDKLSEALNNFRKIESNALWRHVWKPIHFLFDKLFSLFSSRVNQEKKQTFADKYSSLKRPQRIRRPQKQDSSNEIKDKPVGEGTGTENESVKSNDESHKKPVKGIDDRSPSEQLRKHFDENDEQELVDIFKQEKNGGTADKPLSSEEDTSYLISPTPEEESGLYSQSIDIHEEGVKLPYTVYEGTITRGGTLQIDPSTNHLVTQEEGSFIQVNGMYILQGQGKRTYKNGDTEEGIFEMGLLTQKQNKNEVNTDTMQEPFSLAIHTETVEYIKKRDMYKGTVEWNYTKNFLLQSTEPLVRDETGFFIFDQGIYKLNGNGTRTYMNWDTQEGIFEKGLFTKGIQLKREGNRVVTEIGDFQQTKVRSSALLNGPNCTRSWMEGDRKVVQQGRFISGKFIPEKPILPNVIQ